MMGGRTEPGDRLEGHARTNTITERRAMRSAPRLLTRILPALLACTVNASLLAQGTRSNDTVTPTSVELNREPLRIDELNLNMLLPVGSVSETTSFGNNVSVGVGFPGQIGVMIIKEQRTTDADLTLNQVTESIMKQLTRFGNSRTGTVLDHDKQLEINGRVGQRFYIRIPGTNGKPDTVRGMTIFKSQPQRFAILDLTTLYRDFDKCRVIYETSVGTMDLGNPTDQDVRRAAAVRRMLDFLALRSVEDYQAAMTGKNDRWERLYLPAPSGDDMDATEYGYRRISSWGGFKGELTEKSRNKWNDDDRTLGYFVQIDAMAIEEDMRVDTRATFYVAEDGSEESWTIKMSLRQGTASSTSTITGARSRKNLVVLTDSSEGGPVKTNPLIQGDGYISQAQSYLISNMLARSAEPGEYAGYAYNSAASAITLRWDVVEKPQDTPDLVRVTTKVSSDTPPTVSIYNAEGDLIRVRLSNGRIWEPIELDRLINLWQKKGLPLD